MDTFVINNSYVRELEMMFKFIKYYVRLNLTKKWIFAYFRGGPV